MFDQHVLERRADCIVTFLERTSLEAPLVIDGRIALENDSPAIWFTFPGAWHDIGRFHRANHTFTGFYANILTPVRFLSPNLWETTDLFLDVWSAEGTVIVLDAEELDAAVARDWVDQATAARARDETAALLRRARRGEWPPRIVSEWTLERALEVRRGSG